MNFNKSEDTILGMQNHITRDECLLEDLEPLVNECNTYEKFKNFMMNIWEYSSGQVMDGDSLPDLYKLPVVGYVVVKDMYDSIQTYPITSCDNYTDYEQGGYDLNEGETFVTVIPTSTKMFKVCSNLPEGTPEDIMNENYTGWKFKVLGWEYEGMPAQDWNKIYRETCCDFVWRHRKIVENEYVR